MLEAEAKTKWCPFARVAALYSPNSQIVAINRAPQGYDMPDSMPDCFCLASGCMAWRPIYGEQIGVGDGQCGLAAIPPSNII